MKLWRRGDLVVLLLILLAIVAVFAWVAQPVHAQDAERIFADGFETPGEPGGEIDACADPLVMPAGFAHRTKTWVAAFTTPGSPQPATYPNSSGYPVPVPGYESFTRYQQGWFRLYTKADFVAIGFEAKPQTSVTMTWDTAQSGPNYGMPRPADAMFVGISPCPWDGRPSTECARVSGLDSLFFTTLKPTPSGVCGGEGGQTYYINVLMAHPWQGFHHTCSTTAANSAEGCDVQMRHTGN